MHDTQVGILHTTIFGLAICKTCFEEDKDLHVVINAVIAWRYNVTEYLGFVAFIKATQAHGLHTRMDLCMKIIKNNKDFFDQSHDEIKLLKYINKLKGLCFALEEDGVEWLETSRLPASCQQLVFDICRH